MAIIALTCRCGKGLKATDALAGKRGKCPRCGNVFLVPESSDLSHFEDSTPIPSPWPGAFLPQSATAPAVVRTTSCTTSKASDSRGFLAIGPGLLLMLGLGIWLRWPFVTAFASLGIVAWGIAALLRLVRRLERRFGGGKIIPLGTAGLILVLTRLLALPSVGKEIDGLFLGVIVGIAVIAPHIGLVMSIVGIGKNSGRAGGACGVATWTVFTVLSLAMK